MAKDPKQTLDQMAAQLRAERANSPAVQIKEPDIPALTKLVEVADAPDPVPEPEPKLDQEIPSSPTRKGENLWASREAANTDEEKRRFYDMVMEARKPPPAPPPPQPVAPQIVAQTKLEMEAGKRTVEKHAEARRINPPPPRDPSEGMMTSVFRPPDYVPDPKKGEGHVRAREL